VATDGFIRHLRHRLAGPFTGERARAAAGVPFRLDYLLTRPRRANEAMIRAACRAAYLGEETSLARVLGRYKMYLDSRDVGMSGHLLLDGFWEMWLTEAMARLVRPGMTVADVGANLGYYTLLMAELVGEHGHVHAFEPNAALAARLRDSISINVAAGRATVHEVALSDSADGADIVIPRGEPKNGTLVATGLWPGAVPVATLRMDALDALARVDVIKIDVEGAEEAVWRGLHGILARGRPMTIFLEFTAARYADPAAFLAAIAAQGFSLAVIELSGEWRTIDAATLLTRDPTVDQTLLLRR
jgi:FkbM family methyltransferase